MKQCFEPWIENNTKIVIIGTMPSEISLAKEMYYANPHNRFWRYLQEILNENLLEATKHNKQTILKKYRIGLWDALASCEREGSLDSNIKQEIPNNFKLYPQIKHYFFNGQKSFYFFKKYNGELLNKINYTILPSTSPANASIKDEIKFDLWKTAIIKYLDETVKNS